MKRLAIALLAVVTVWIAGTAIGQQAEDRYEGREHIKLDHEAMKSMTREERREARKAFKAAREAEIRRSGVSIDAGAGYIPLDSPRPVEERVIDVPGSSIQYDSGTVTGTFTAAALSRMVGNRFDSARNPAGTMCCFPVEASGSITMVTFDMVNTFSSSVFWSLYSNIMGTTAVQVTSKSTTAAPGLNTYSVSSASTANAYANGSFLAGVFQFSVMSTAVGIDTASTGGQGFHAVTLNDGSMASLINDVTAGGMGFNAVFRVSGNVATPVELMNFTIED